MYSKEKPKTGLARCLEIASARKPLVVLSGVFSAISGIASFVPYLSIYGVIREIVKIYPELESIDKAEVSKYAVYALLGILINILTYFLSIVMSHLAAFGTIYDLRTTFAKHLSKIPLGFHITLGSGKLRKIMEDNIDSIEGFIAHQFPDFVASVTAPVCMVIILLAVDWRFGLVALLGIILAFVAEFIGYGSKSMKENLGKYQDALENMNNASVEFVRCMPVIKVFGRERSSFSRLKAAIGEYTEWVLRFSLGWQNCMPAFTTIINNIYLLLVPAGLIFYSFSSDERSFLMNYLFYLLFVPAIAGVMNKIMYISESFMEINEGVARMDEVLNIEAMPDTEQKGLDGALDLEFDNVSFKYEGAVNKALDSVSFKVDPGSYVAIVGRSGSGKSTIASLISRFWDVTEGSVKIGGKDIREIGLAELSSKVSFVYQEVFLFKMSIADNISLGHPGATREDIVKAAKAARCHEFIEQLPQGYDTVVGENGIHLSGGERQRISIARAILSDAPIIILDEATAYSDPENEYLIKQSFAALTDKKTVVMIAHRLGSVTDADEILVMDSGRLVERGTHDNLLRSDGRYKEMWSSYTNAMNWKIGGANV